MNIQKHMVAAVLTGVLFGVLMGAGTVRYASFLAQGIPPTYAKSIKALRTFGDYDRIFVLPRIQNRIEDQGHVYKRSAPKEPSPCDELSGQRLTRCKAAEKEGITYQRQDIKAR